MSHIVCEENVNRYYGDNSALLAKYKEIVASGKCPFCEPNIENEVAWRNKHWIAVDSQFPYKGTKLHFLILPRRHVMRLQDFTVEEWADMDNVIMAAHHNYPMQLCDGFGLALRDGSVGGVTLYHLHWHLILPERGKDGSPVPVNFGIG